MKNQIQRGQMICIKRFLNLILLCLSILHLIYEVFNLKKNYVSLFYLEIEICNLLIVMIFTAIYYFSTGIKGDRFFKKSFILPLVYAVVMILFIPPFWFSLLLFQQYWVSSIFVVFFILVLTLSMNYIDKNSPKRFAMSRIVNLNWLLAFQFFQIYVSLLFISIRK
jgi:hypothetical protein